MSVTDSAGTKVTTLTCSAALTGANPWTSINPRASAIASDIPPGMASKSLWVTTMATPARSRRAARPDGLRSGTSRAAGRKSSG